MEFPLRHHGRHDASFDRQRQHRNPQAVERLADNRAKFIELLEEAGMPEA